MKAAAIVFNNDDYLELTGYERLVEKIKSWLVLCHEHGIRVVVLPALLGCFFDDSKRYINDIIEQSKVYEGMAICPGSYYESDLVNTYHSSCIIMDGHIKMKQRQIYLAKWERELGLSRGIELSSISLGGMKLGVMLSTDVFYPQVSRVLAMSGVELVLAPTAVKRSGNMSRQLAGLWQNVQSNLFFGIESSFNGSFKGHDFRGSSIIHAPLDMTSGEDGFLAHENMDLEGTIIIAELDNEKRRSAVRRFNTLAQLNKEAYKDLFMLSHEVSHHE